MPSMAVTVSVSVTMAVIRPRIFSWRDNLEILSVLPRVFLLVDCNSSTNCYPEMRHSISEKQE